MPICCAPAMSPTPRSRNFFQTMHERINAVATELLFFTLELNRLDDAALDAKLADPALAHYRPWLRDVRAMRPYQLSDELEKMLLEKSVTGRAAWVRLFDETVAELRFPFRGRELTEAEAMHLLSDPDGAVRREAALSIGEVLGKNGRVFALITNTLAKDKEIEDRWRKFPRPISARNLSNFVEDEVVDALIAAVRASYENLSHRYYRLKARWFGVEQLPFWDRNAPLPGDVDRTLGWSEARDTVLSAYRAFSPELAAVGEHFFASRWIDAPVRPGKAPGAFAHPTVPSAHPYLLLNYQGRLRDVMTLAHELGHGVHQVLAAGQGALMADTPLTLAETASVFGEMLTFRALLAAETDPAKRRIMLAGKVEDMLNTVIRQIAFVTFETRVHDERREAELTAERIVRDLARRTAREPGAGIAVRRSVPMVLDLHPAFHPFAVLCLCLCVRRLPGEFALCGVPGKARRFFRTLSRHAARRRQNAAPRIAGAVRIGRKRPGFLVEGTVDDRRVYR